MNDEREIEGVCWFMNRILLISLLTISLFSGCNQSPKPPVSQDNSALVPVDTITPFIPPVDSIIAPVRFSAWFACNKSLDSLSIAFTNTVAGGKSVPGDSARSSFCRAQDRICALHGLKGGYVEYRWIMENLGNSKNKALYDSLKCR
jgi:hypothetical protein